MKISKCFSFIENTLKISGQNFRASVNEIKYGNGK
jgi:hypothetical protein